MSDYEQPKIMEALQTELAEAIERSGRYARAGERSVTPEYVSAHAFTVIANEMRIARLEKMIKAEKRRLKRMIKAEKRRLKRMTKAEKRRLKEEVEDDPTDHAPLRLS